MTQEFKKEKKNLIALIYCRVSSDRQKNEGHGLESQEFRCREYARQNSYRVEEVFRDSFTGGGNFMKRPAMRELLSYIDENPNEDYVVIFDDLKRFARDMAFHIKLRGEFSRRSVVLKCLNFNFEDSPMGEFSEGVLALAAQLERKQNRIQVIQKMKARLEAGYWTFFPPPGYKGIKHKLHGSLLTPQEPIASIIREAFEGYASDRFLEQKDVQEFLQNRDFHDGGMVYLQQVKRLLVRVIYAGYIEYPNWGVERRKGHHEPLVSMETFERVQEKLEGRAIVRTRKDFNKVFPLRGFACCSKCGELFTASESTGRMGKKYPFYRCRYVGCSERTKSIRKDDLEDEFESKVIQSKPNKRAVQLIERIVGDVYKKKRDERYKAHGGVERRLDAINNEIKSLVERVPKTTSDIVVQTYEAQIENLSNEKLLLEKKINKLKSNTVDVGTAFKAVLGYVKNPIDMWHSDDLNDKRRVFQLVFADKFIYDRESGVGTAKYSVLFRVFEQFDAQNNIDVEMARIELACK